ncbi:MAG: chromate efflux transporter [Chitinophagaceae bacterium]
MQIFLRFLRFGCLAWGGPVAQIAMIKKELVEEENWISKEQFNRALAVYQMLPGPEAHELCVYFGMKAAGRWGGFLAGLGFMLPGFLLMLLLTWFYVNYGIQSPLIQMIFTGIQAAVVSLIFFAVYRIGKHSIVNYKLLVIAIAGSLAFFLGVNFLIILLLAGAAYFFWSKRNLMVIAVAILHAGFCIFTVLWHGFPVKPGQSEQQASVGLKGGSAGQVLVTGLKGGLLSFGGAYTAIPVIQEDAVIKQRWMTEDQFLDGIALSGILPAPLIIFSTFVGYFGGGWWGAILITIGVFLPAFSFTLMGHSLLEKVIANKGLHSFLDGVTASVIGLIAITAIRLLLTNITSLQAIIVFSIALLLLIKFRSKYTVIFIIPGAGLFNLIWHYV